jgi:FtsZ-binding cell division protein ZapB
VKIMRRALIMAAVLVPAVAAAQTRTGGSEGEVLDSTRSTVAKWVETQQIISKEKKDWQLGKDVLLQRISLIESEIASLEDKIAETRKGIDDADDKRDELAAQNGQLKSAAASLYDRIGPLEEKTRRLLATLPEPLRERVEPLSQRIPDDPSVADASISERFQNVIGVLNEVNKFDRDVSVTNELRRLPDGSMAEVTVVYLGLGQAYYVTSGGDGAGVGRPTQNGWEWTAANHLAPEIRQAVEILQNTQPPAFVPLPVEIR